MTNAKKTPSNRELIAAKQQAVAKVKHEPGTEVAGRDNGQDYKSRYLDEVAPASIVGRLVKFGKDATFITADDGQEISVDAEFAVLAEETLVGWCKFNGDGEPPDRVMGLLYDGFVMPKRESLGDLDQKQWELGLDGQPQDPWLHQMYLVLQNTATLELLTFVTSSRTGRRSVGNLLRHYDRMHKTAPSEVPVIRLRTGGFQHRDTRVGFVSTPVFVVVGRRATDTVAKPDTSIAAFLDDKLPF